MSENPIVMTDNAAKKIFSLIQEEGNIDLKLRVYITGGGCSGFQYGFTFDEIVQPDDQVITKLINVGEETEEEEETELTSRVGLLVDAISLQYLMGAEIDYQEDIEGERFIIRNPNAKTTCGCGSSFTMEG